MDKSGYEINQWISYHVPKKSHLIKIEDVEVLITKIVDPLISEIVTEGLMIELEIHLDVTADQKTGKIIN